MSDQLTLPAEARDRAGKGASRALRRDGRVPAVVYGEKREPLSIHVEEKLLAKMLSTGHFMNSVIMIDFQVKLPNGVTAWNDEEDFTVATIVAPSAMKAEEEEAAAAGEVPTVEGEEAEGEATEGGEAGEGGA